MLINKIIKRNTENHIPLAIGPCNQSMAFLDLENNF